MMIEQANEIECEREQNRRMNEKKTKWKEVGNRE